MTTLRRLLARCALAGLVFAAAAGPVAAALGVPDAAAVRSSAGAVLLPTPGAVSVRDYGASGTGTADDTAAFEAAMTAALGPGAVSYNAGPTGAAQGVVYVPAGTYRLLNLTFPSNLRLEVDAGAILEQAGGRDATSPPGSSSPSPAVVLWDGPPGAPLTNVSLVGVGTATGGVKTLAAPVAQGWSVDNDFTLDLDPKVTNANNTVSGLMAMNVDGFLVANVFSIQNAFEPQTAPTSAAGWWPSSRKAAFGLRARSDSPVDKSAFYDPHDGTISNWYNVGSPPGYGPSQIDSAHNVSLSHIYSQGGTTLRLETDNSNQLKFGSELRAIIADDIAGSDCNRAVSFAPHFQINHDVHVTNVRATACYQGVVESADKSIAAAKRGAFLDSTIADVTVAGGSGAQDPNLVNNGLWTIGSSVQAFARDKQNTWSVLYTSGTFSCSGGFQKRSDSIATTNGMVRPSCAP